MTRRRAVTLLAIGVLMVATPVAADHIPEQHEDAKLLASDGEARDWFGQHVAIDGNTIVVGSDRDDDQGEESGSAHVFERDESGSWVETAKLLASGGEVHDFFAAGVSLDGDTIVVTATGDDDLGENSGAAYVFERVMLGNWVEVAKLVASDGVGGEVLGTGVAIERNTIVVGAELQDDLGPHAGAAYVFERDETGVWLETTKLLASDGEESDAFGCNVAIDGDRIIVGARGDDDQGSTAGAAYVFQRDEFGVWIEAAKLVASDGQIGDLFGSPVAIDGEIVAVGAPGNDDLGSSTGKAYVFEPDESGTWVETAKLYSPHPAALDGFGRVAVHGNTVLVGAWSGDGQPGDSTGTVDFFRRNESGEWINSARLLPSIGDWGDQFGLAVAIDGDTVVVGARLDDDLGEDSGAAYIFEVRPHLSVAGTCPGTVGVGVTGATGDGLLGVLLAAGEGITPVPGGPCPGVELGLADPSLLAVLTVDPDGKFSASPTIPEPACGQFLQAVDLATCRVSNVEQLP